MNKSCTGLSLCACCILAACTAPPAIPEPQPEVLPFLPQVVPQQKVQEKNGQRCSTLQAALNTCTRIDIALISNGAPHTHRCTAAETQNVLRLFSRLKALPFEGSIHALPAGWNILKFYDSNGKELISVTDWEITDEAASAHPYHCEAKATMYLGAADYAEFEQLLQDIAD